MLLHKARTALSRIVPKRSIHHPTILFYFSTFKDRSEMSVLRTKSQVASWSLNKVIARNEDLRSTYLYQLIDYLLFKTEKIPVQKAHKKSPLSELKESHKSESAELIRSNFKDTKYQFNQATTSLLQQKQDVSSLLQKRQDLSLQQDTTSTLYQINLGKVQAKDKSQTSFQNVLGTESIQSTQQISQKEQEYEVLLIGKQNAHQVMQTSIFQQRELSNQIVAGSKFYEGVKHDQGLFYYYFRNIFNVIGGIALFLLVFQVYMSRDLRREYNQEVMDMRVFRMRCDGVQFNSFYHDHITRNQPHTI